MPTTFNPRITAAGLAATIAANGAGLDLQLTHIALGSGKYDPTGAETALVNRRETTTIAPGSSAGPATLSVIATFSGYVGADYDLGEVGFFAGDPAAGGVLFAVASRAGLRYAIRSAAVETYTPQFTLALTGVPAGSISVTVDATGNVAASLVANHIAAANPHPQYALLADLDDGNPIGFVGMFYARTAPRGWLALNGALVSRATYALLWAHAQAQGLVTSEALWAAGRWTEFSSGNGSTTFRLPDARAEFVRAWDDGRGVDPARALGSWQAAQIESHVHPLSDAILTEGVAGAGAGGTTSGTSGVPVQTGSFGGTETRGRNFALLLCIKAGPKTLPAGPASAPTPAPAPAPTPPAPPPPGSPPVAEFTGTPLSLPYGGGAVAFTDASTNTPTSWAWTFGDGGTSTLRNPTHVYAARAADGPAARFDVTLTATNADGSSTRTRLEYVFRDGGSDGGGS